MFPVGHIRAEGQVISQLNGAGRVLHAVHKSKDQQKAARVNKAGHARL